MASRVGDNNFCKDSPEKTELKDVGVSIYRYKIKVDDVYEKTKNLGKYTVNATNVFLVVDTKEHDGTKTRTDQEHEKEKSTCKRCQYVLQEQLLESNKDVFAGICDHCRAKLEIEGDVRAICDKVLSKYYEGRLGKDNKIPNIPSWFKQTAEKDDETFRKKMHEHLRTQRELEDEYPRRLRTKYFSEDSLIVPFPHLREHQLSDDESYLLEQTDVKGETDANEEPFKPPPIGSPTSSEITYMKGISFPEKHQVKRRQGREFGMEDRQIDEVTIDKEGKKVIQLYGRIGSSKINETDDFDLKSLAELKQKDKHRGHKSAHEIRLPDTKEAQSAEKHKVTKVHAASKEYIGSRSKSKVDKDIKSEKESRQDKGITQEKPIKPQTTPKEAVEMQSKPIAEKEKTQRVSSAPKESLEIRSKAKEEKHEQVPKSQTMPKPPPPPKVSASKSTTTPKSPSVPKVKETKTKTQDEKQEKQEQPVKTTPLPKPAPKTLVEGKTKQHDEKEIKQEKAENPHATHKEASEVKSKPQTEEKLKHDQATKSKSAPEQSIAGKSKSKTEQHEKPSTQKKTEKPEKSRDTKAEKEKATNVSEKVKKDKSKTEQHEKPSSQKESEKSGKSKDTKENGSKDAKSEKEKATKDLKVPEKGKDDKLGKSDVSKQKEKEINTQEKEKNLKPPSKGKSDQLLGKDKNLKSSQKEKKSEIEKVNVVKSEKGKQKGDNAESQQKIKDGKPEKGLTKDEKHIDKNEETAKKKDKAEKEHSTKKQPKSNEIKIIQEKKESKHFDMTLRKGEEEKKTIEVKSIGAAPTDKELPPANLAQQLKDLEEKSKKKAAENADKRPKHTDREIKMNEVIMAAEIDTLKFALPKSEKQHTTVLPELPPIPGNYILKEVIAELPEDPLAFQSKIERHKARSISHLTTRDETILRNYITSDRDKATLKKLSPVMVDSELALDLESLLNASEKAPHWTKQMIKGTQIVRRDEKAFEEEKGPNPPMLFHMKKMPVDDLTASRDTTSKKAESDQGDKQPLSYALSDRTFIEKGWTVLPTEKVLRKMNIYRMRPSRPEFDWFEHNKNKGVIKYDTGEKLAEFDDDGRARCYYRNGRLALNYYDTEDTNAQQRYVVYSSGEQDSRGRSRPVTILAMFDYSGNGIVFDHNGKIRLKYNQSEGVVLDRSLGPVSHWKWHSLNDPPVLQQVMIDTHMTFKDPEIVKLGQNQEDHKKRPSDDEKMLAIEFENFVKEKTKKLSAKFLPYQIKMKALEINEQFSLKILDQATIYLLYKDGSTHLKLNLGMTLDHHEIVDTETVELGEVSSSLEKFPAKTSSLEELQLCLMKTKRMNRVRTEREQKLRPPVARTVESADKLAAATSKPLHPANVRLATGEHRCRYRRKEPTTVLYYNTRLI